MNREKIRRCRKGGEVKKLLSVLFGFSATQKPQEEASCLMDCPIERLLKASENQTRSVEQKESIVSTDFKPGDLVLVLPDNLVGEIIKKLPTNGIRPTEYHVRGKGLSKNYWRAEQLEKLGSQERLEV